MNAPDKTQDPDVARAVRLARVIASDIAVYHPEQIAQGITKDTFFELMAPQLDKGLALYQSRVAAHLDPDARHYWQAVVDVIIAGMGHIGSPMW